MINGVMQPCDTADFNRDGEVNGDDITAFIAAKQGTYYVPAGDIGDYRFLYRGYWYDRHLHIYHVRHRAYDPEIQRWLQPDPAYFVDGLNRYAYCGNEPVHMYDPMGLYSVSDFIGEVTDGFDEAIDHLSGLTRAQDAAWLATMQIQRAVDQQSLNQTYAQLIEVRDGETRAIIDTAVVTVVILATGGAAGGVVAGSFTGSMAQGMMIGMGSDMVAQSWQMQMGVRDRWDYNRTAAAGVAGGAGGALAVGVSKLVGAMARIGGNSGDDLIRAFDPSDGVIYLRRDRVSGDEYVGQAKDWQHYLIRQKRHTQEAGGDFEFEVLAYIKNPSKQSLNVAEETWIRRLGGPKREGGPLENYRHQMNDCDYRKAGGTEASS